MISLFSLLETHNGLLTHEGECSHRLLLRQPVYLEQVQSL